MPIPESFSFAYANHVATAGVTITADAADTAFPAANLTNTSLFISNRTTTAVADHDWDIDFGATRTFQCISVLATNWTDSATWEIFGDDEPTFTAPTTILSSATVFDTSSNPTVTYVPSWGRHATAVFTSEQSFRYVRIRLNDTSNSEGHYRQGHIIASQLFSPVVGWAPGVSWQEKLSGPSISPRVSDQLVLSMDDLTEVEGESLKNFMRSLATVGRFLVIPRPQNTAAYLKEVKFVTAKGATFSPFGGDRVKMRASLVEVIT